MVIHCGLEWLALDFLPAGVGEDEGSRLWCVRGKAGLDDKFGILFDLGVARGDGDLVAGEGFAGLRGFGAIGCGGRCSGVVEEVVFMGEPGAAGGEKQCRCETNAPGQGVGSCGEGVSPVVADGPCERLIQDAFLEIGELGRLGRHFHCGAEKGPEFGMALFHFAGELSDVELHPPASQVHPEGAKDEERTQSVMWLRQKQ